MFFFGKFFLYLWRQHSSCPLSQLNQSAPPLALPAVQTLDYSKDAEHNSSSPVSPIPLYNPQRNLLLCTRWIVCGCVHLRRRRRSFPDSSVVASDCLLGVMVTHAEKRKCLIFVCLFLTRPEFSSGTNHCSYLVSCYYLLLFGFAASLTFIPAGSLRPPLVV